MPIVVANEPAGTQLRLLTLDHVPADHVRVGQYAQVNLGEIAGTFAYASSPGEAAVLLIKDDGKVGTAMAAASPGTSVQLGPSRGGFPMDQVAGHELVILVNGTGISAARSVLREEIARGMPRPVHLLYGVLTPDRAAFSHELDGWRAAGIDVQMILGTPGPDWTGRTGFVQDVARDLGLVRPDVGVVLVGLPAMLDQARAAFRAAGTPESRMLVNF